MVSSLEFPKLPPLKALRGFESTARLRSYRKAAEELSLTHPAISHQIRSLEKNLGVKLFVRKGRQAVLTAEGERFYPIAREALEILINGSEAIRRSSVRRRCSGAPDLKLRVQSHEGDHSSKHLQRQPQQNRN